MRSQLTLASLLTGLLGSLTLQPSAHACGGLFCSTTQPVNQAAERIVFAVNADDTVTAVIEIQYAGPSNEFSWLLPIGAVPETLRVSSNQAFARLQTATNPQYSLTTRIEGTCRQDDDVAVAFASPAFAGTPAAPRGNDAGGVTVEASGNVGPFDWTVLSVAEGTSEPAQEAVEWLEQAGYDVPDSAPGLLGPYLSDGLYLLALKLTKGADTGSIRPIVVTYPGTTPMIPLRPTSVAANPDMGVMTWLLGEGRGVPTNYLSLELNEARLNWFNPASNYNTLVTEAADEAGGQGFVTEYADAASQLSNVVWTQYEEANWQQLSSTSFDSFEAMYSVLNNTWSSYDGYLDALEQGVTLSASISREDFRACPGCYADQVEFAPSELLAALEENVIEPMRLIQDLLDEAPNVTRLYTTLSPEEMTVDPAFTFNTALPNVSNVHTAERVIECNEDVLQREAPFRIVLPQGDVVRGKPEDLNSGVWPAALAALPSNRTVSKLSSSGSGRVAEDNRETIAEQLAEYNGTIPSGPSADGGCAVASATRSTTNWPWLMAIGLVMSLRRRRSRRASC